MLYHVVISSSQVERKETISRAVTMEKERQELIKVPELSFFSNSTFKQKTLQQQKKLLAKLETPELPQEEKQKIIKQIKTATSLLDKLKAQKALQIVEEPPAKKVLLPDWLMCFK